MLVLKLITSFESTTLTKNKSNESFINIFLQDSDEINVLTLNYDFMKQKYGFPISKYECDCFLTHYTAWQTFFQSEEKYCLVLEDTTNIISPNDEVINEIQSLLDNIPDWDVFFPFDPTIGNENIKPSIGYVLGYPWGSDAYFISKKGITKLLQIREIKQPVDEEILSLSLTEELEIYYEDIQMFTFTRNTHRHVIRRNAIKDAIFNYNLWTEESKKKAVSLIDDVSKLAKLANLDLVLADGSLLGYIRHNKIMPWDDDVDFSIDGRFIDFFKSYIDEHSNLKTKNSEWGTSEVPYLKIWDENGKEIPGHTHKWPFIDVWPYMHLGDEIVFPHGNKYPADLFYPLSCTDFEGSTFKLPSHPLDYLDILYSDWRTNIQVYFWRHQEEQATNIPLNLDIVVDKYGKMIPDKSP